jgi:HEAT repeat protein
VTSVPDDVGAAADDASALARVAALPDAERAAVLGRLLRSPAGDTRESALRVGAALLSADQLVAFLRDGEDATLRNAAVEMLKLCGRAVVPLAIELLSDRDADVVLQAVLVLDHARDPRALEPLRGALGHANLNVVQAAIVAIGHVGTRAVVDDLVPFLGREPWVQMAAIEALGDLRAPEAVAPLAALLEDAFLGDLAADAIARVGGGSAFACLAIRWLGEAPGGGLERLAHTAEGLTEAPPEVLGLLPALEAALRADDAASPAAARCLLAAGASAGDGAALDLLARTWPDHRTLPACLRRRRDLIASLLARTDRGRGWGFRLAAAYPAFAPLDALDAALASCGLDDLDAIADVLLAVGDERLGGRLLEVFARLPEATRSAWGPLLRRHRVALRAALERGATVPPRIREVLEIAIEPDAERVVWALEIATPGARIEGLRYVADRPDVLQRLPWVEWLDGDPDLYGSQAVAVAERAGLRLHLPRLRAVAARRPHRELLRLLGRLRDRESLDLLEAIARAGRPDLRPFAIGALGTIGGATARQVLRAIAATNPACARFAYRALAECHIEEDVAVFRAAADHGDWHVRMIVADVLGRTGDAADLALVARLAADPVSAVADRARARLTAR